MLGDVKQTPQSLSDTEITYLLSKNQQHIRLTAADAAEIMGNRYSELSVTSKSVGDLSLSFSYETVGGRFTSMAERFRKATGLGSTFRMADNTESQFHIGMTDNGQGERERVYRRDQWS